jgi:hypothetical protein
MTSRRKCETSCGRPATLYSPPPWDLAWCDVHADLAAKADAAHWKWALAQTLTADGTLASR